MLLLIRCPAMYPFFSIAIDCGIIIGMTDWSKPCAVAEGEGAFGQYAHSEEGGLQSEGLCVKCMPLTLIFVEL